MRLLIFTFGVVLSMAAATASAQEDMYIGPGDGSISGTVRRGREGLAGVTITVTNRATGTSQVTISGEGGRFSIAALSSGQYTVEAALSGFETRTLSAEVQAGKAAYVEINFGGPDPVSSPATGAVAGTVRAGEAKVVDAKLDFAPAGGGESAHAATNSDGYYSRDYLTPGTYNVTCFAKGLKPSTQTVTVERDRTVTLDFVLEKQ